MVFSYYYYIGDSMNKIDILKDYFGYDSLKKEQERVIDSVLSLTDTIGVLPTGYGKSVAFQIPALLFRDLTLVITPLISLMQDQVVSLKRKGIKAEYISSLQNDEEIDNIYDKLNRNRIKLLYIAPERLLTKKFLKNLNNVKISLIVIDEAHTLLWGEDFRKSMLDIPSFISFLGYKPVLLALTATANKATLEKITKIGGLLNPNIFVINCDRDNIFYKIVKTNNKIKDLLKNLGYEKTIIYTLTIKSAEELYEYLGEKGYNSFLYHGELDKERKKEEQKNFCKASDGVMVATNAFGMGIDIPDIRKIILFDMPSCIEDFMQQTGRASRDGKYAEAVLLFNMKDINTISFFIEKIADKDVKKNRYDKLEKMVSLCLSNKCIHKVTCEYFGVKYKKKKCMMCSNCK